jgi:electron transfer flavoprotein alpha subunit
VIAAGTSRWSRALPGVAYRLGGRVDTHATALDERNGVSAVTRWFYRQRMEAVLTRGQRPWIVLLDSGCVAAMGGRSGHGDSGGGGGGRLRDTHQRDGLSRAADR